MINIQRYILEKNVKYNGMFIYMYVSNKYTKEFHDTLEQNNIILKNDLDKKTNVIYMFSLDDNGDRTTIRTNRPIYYSFTKYVITDVFDFTNSVFVNDESVRTINFDLLIRKYKIRQLYDLCLTQYPKIYKFTKDNIYLCKVPRSPTTFFYDEVYNKGVLRKDKLEIGKYYYGKCRNAKVAMWDGSVFVYMRDKWGTKYPEEINHLADDNGYDLFIPIKEVIPTDVEIIKEND